MNQIIDNFNSAVTISFNCGRNNISKKIFKQFKELNSLQNWTNINSSFSPQAVMLNNKKVGFTTVFDLQLDFINNNINPVIRQNYNYDEILIADLKTGIVYLVNSSVFDIGSVTRKTPGSDKAYNTIINIIDNPTALINTSYVIYP